jgi:hypothetical protein
MERKRTWIFHSPVLFKVAVRAVGGLRRLPSDRKQSDFDAIIPVLFATLALEGFANELGELAADEFYWGRDSMVSLFALLFGEAERVRASTSAKLNLVSMVYGGTPFPLDRSPHQDVALLFELRNALAHLKLDYRQTHPTGKGLGPSPKLIAKLRSRRILVAGPDPSETGWLTQISTRAAGVWACRTVKNTVDLVVAKIASGSGSEFSSDVRRYLSGPFDSVSKGGRGSPF